MPGIATLGKHFFLIFNRFGRKSRLLKSNRRYPDQANTAVKNAPLISCTGNAHARGRPTSLVVGRIILSGLGRRCRLPALHVRPAVALWGEFAFLARIRRDDHSATGGQTENQLSIRRDPNHPRVPRSPSAWRRLRVPLVKKRLPSSGPVRCQSGGSITLSRRTRLVGDRRLWRNVGLRG